MKSLKIISVLLIVFLGNASFKKVKQIDKDDYYIIVNKTRYTLTIYDRDNSFVVEYPAVFGNNDKGDKMYEGDRKHQKELFTSSAKGLILNGINF